MDKATELLARYATELRFEDLPAEVVHDAKLKLIDTLGCAIGAFDEEPCRIARALARRCVGRPPARRSLTPLVIARNEGKRRLRARGSSRTGL